MKDKELAKQEYLEMIKKSWTWAKLTEKEKDRFLSLLDNPCSTTIIKGDYDQRWDACEALYHFYLLGLDYDPLNWRENYLETTHYEINYKESGKDKQESMTNENMAKIYTRGLKQTAGVTDVSLTKVVIRTACVDVR